MQKRKMFKKLGTMLFATILAMAPVASVSAAGGNHNLPDTTRAGSITVHKYLRDVASTTIGTSLELEDTDGLGTPAEGVTFSLYKVRASYSVTEDTSVSDALSNSDLVSRETTGANGIIKWSWPSNAAGYYVLVEDPATTPEGYVPVPDSIIALPYGVDDDSWNYDIHVYPKNVSDKELIKRVENKKEGYSVGDTVEWKYTAKVDISKLFDGTSNYGTYKITDALDSRLDFVETTDLTAVGGPVDVPLTSPGDYSVSAASGTVVWTLTPAGVAKVVAANATGIELSFETEVNDTAYAGSSSPEISNGGKLEWENHDGSEAGGYEIPDEEKPTITLYNVEIQKTNSDGSKLLDGAVFKIATSKANALANSFIKTDAGTDVTVTTDAHPTDAMITGGWAMFAGLPVNNGSNTTFWLVEDVAPTTADGKYIRPGEPIEVTIKNHDGVGEEKVSTSITIKNYLPSDPDVPEKWKLPLTGGMGTVIFYVIGAVVMIGAVVLFIKSKKTKMAQ